MDNYLFTIKTNPMRNKIFYIIILLLSGILGVNAQTVQIEDAVEAPGQITVQVDMLNYTDVAAITLYLDFDSDLLEFVGIDDEQLTGNWYSNFNEITGQAIITYQATPFGTGYPINGKAFDLVFNYAGGFSSDIAFDTDFCEIADGDLQAITTTYVDGSVSQSASLGEVSMDDLTQPIGNTILMPITMEGTGLFNAVDAFTFIISFDNTELAFAGITQYAATGIIANEDDGVLTLTWTSATAQDFTTLTTLLTVNFVYYGGTSDVEFLPVSEVSSGLTLLATDYVDGTVTPQAQSASLTIETVEADSGDVVNVPIIADDITQTLGSISLSFDFDDDKLDYGNYTANQLSGWIVNENNGTVTITWSSGTGSTITDGDLITLNFLYHGGVAELNFNPGNEIKTTNLVNVPVDYIDGFVSDLKVSGTVKYVSGDVIPNTTVYLKSPDGLTTYGSDVADASGNFEILGAVPGSYILDASTTANATYSYDLTDAFIIFGTGGSLTGLYLLAGDVNEDASADMTDAFIVYGSFLAGNVKVVSWIAPDWMFENPSVVVVNDDVVQNFEGICSGDANGDFVPVP